MIDVRDFCYARPIGFAGFCVRPAGHAGYHQSTASSQEFALQEFAERPRPS